VVGMDARAQVSNRNLARAARFFELVGGGILRYGLVLLLVGIGSLKFTEAEALAIQPWVAHSPFLGWLYVVTSVQGASNLIGIIEIPIGILLAVHRWFPRLSAIGGVGASVTFLITLSFLFTTPDLSPDAAGFLMKDFMLLGAALWTAGQWLRSAESRHRASPLYGRIAA
jgi:reactive chlorine resistance protein C